ncbi:MAG: TauD/TfdA family dioxygenase [Ilumatobacteraceae bacterium]
MDATFGAVVTGVRLAAIDDAGWSLIENAFNEHAVLVFPGQHLSEAQQKSFGRRLGPLETIGAEEGITQITNQRPDGTLLAVDHPGSLLMRGNEGWHTDSSYMPVSAKASMLSAHIVASSGGDTEWADMRDAYDSLDLTTRQRIAGLAAYHSIVRAQESIGPINGLAGFYGFEDRPAPLRPLVKVHPVTGRSALFIGRHAYGIPGLPAEESVSLLDDLLHHACRPPRVYVHHWQVGDLVLWDNRCVLHRARPYDPNEARRMVHTRVSGDPATESAIGFAPDPVVV